jgi:hypothetical protein
VSEAPVTLSEVGRFLWRVGVNLRWLILLALVGTIGTTKAAAAQPAAPGPHPEGPIRAGDCRVTVVIGKTGGAGDVEISVNGLFRRRQSIDGRERVTIALNGPLAAQDQVRARVVAPNAVSDFSEPLIVAASDQAPQRCGAAQAALLTGDGRQPFWASGYIGGAIDNFAPAEVGGYVNPGAGGASDMRFVAGVDFQFRMFGRPDSRMQLWLGGETLHGVRSADVNCTGEPRPPVCQSLGQDPSKQFLFILQHASSLEAYIAPRLEFATLQQGTAFPSKLYVTMRFGVMMLDDQVHDSFDTHHFGVGLLSTAGEFEGSYLEVGWGRSDLFLTLPGASRWRRLKIDGLVSFPFPGLNKIWETGPNAFLQLYSDFDPAGGSSDSVQTFFGLDFDLDKLFTW